MTETSTQFVRGDRVRVKGERSTYRVQRDELNRDGSIALFGGDMDPNGCQGFRDVMPSRLSIDKRKRKSA